MNKRTITTRIIVNGVFSHSYTKLRRVYTDKKGDYVNCNGNRCYIKEDSFDLSRKLVKSDVDNYNRLDSASKQWRPATKGDIGSIEL